MKSEKKNQGFIQIVIIIIVVVFVAIGAMFALGLFAGNQSDNPGKTAEMFAEGGLKNIPEEYAKVFSAAGEKWKVQPAFIAAMFMGGEHGGGHSDFHFNPSIPWPDITGPWASSTVGASGPFQFMPITWEGHKQDGNGDGRMEIQNIWDSAFAAAHLCAMNGAGGNTTDLDKLRDAASRYNSGKPWSVGQTFKETRPYVGRVIEAYQYFYEIENIIAGSLANFNPYRLYQTEASNPLVRRVGCAVTSVCMAVNYAMQKQIIIPDTVWDLYTPGGNNMSWGLPTSTPTELSGKIKYVPLGSAKRPPTLEKIKCYLNQQIPVVIGANTTANIPGRKSFTSSAHRVLIIGVSPDNTNFILADPMNRNPIYPIASLLNPSAFLGSHIYYLKSKGAVCP
ncbi:MAG: C39 family peptidase [Patescibacteria group bacterium]|jgi:hypothetical protein